MSFEYLPGIQVSTQDRGLATRRIPTSKTTVVVGTSGRGPADVPYQVEDRATAVRVFGLEGSLIRTMEELVQGGCDNVVLFRIGTQPMVVSGIGADTAANEPGYTIEFSRRQADAPQRYRVYYSAGRLEVWFDGQLVYSNDPAGPIDVGDVLVSGTATGGDAIAGTGATNFDRSWTVTQIQAEANPSGDLPTVSVALPVDGLSMTKRQLYLALQKAYDLLSIMQIQRIVVPDAALDNPNVAFWRNNPATAVHNPADNPDALDWLRTTYSADGEPVYHWASETVDSTGAAVSPATFTTAAQRLSAGYHEVSFGYQLARFCAVQSENLGGCLGFIGTLPPAGFSPKDLRRWIGKSPEKNENGLIVAAGSGLAGIPYLSGAPASSLNVLCHDYSSGQRKPGFFLTSDPASPTGKGEYDMPADVDENGYPVDIGAYIHVVAAVASLTNGMGTYVNNLAALACGISSRLDDKEALTNKPALGCAQVYRLGMNELDLLTKSKVNELRFRGMTQLPVFVHDRTAADSESDYIFLQRQQIKFLVVDAIYKEAEPFIGQSTTDGLQLAALKTALERRATELAKRGYVSGAEFSIMSTEADRRIGRAYIDVKFNPADQVVQLRARVAIGR